MREINRKTSNDKFLNTVGWWNLGIHASLSRRWG